MQQDFYDSCKAAFGEDVSYWILPLHPELKTNYFERVWSKKEVKRMYKSDVFEKDTDNYDSDKKLFSVD
jgi:hypothetical protein